ncbi:kinase-like domain-containing protein, partial [Absidia repens]
MQRYQRTLKQYTHAHTHHRLSAHQKMDLIRQMLLCLQVIHQHGLAHRDISEVNFMVDEAPHKILDDGSVGANVYLIDFGKAVFTRPEDVRRWWIEPDDYEGEVIPKTKDELETWCKQLPLVSVKPDHGYRCYRSIQTLPRNRTDHAVLPWLVDPVAEDMYSIAALIWKVFAETEPWHGILDSDLKGLRERVEDDERIETQIGREVSGEVSKQLLLSCLKTQPQDRFSATQLLAWIDQPHVTQQLLDE